MKYRETPEELREELKAEAKKLIEDSGFLCFPALCALEAKPPVEWDKGRAAIYILRTAFGVDWNERIKIVFAGDDVGDEDAIEALKGFLFFANAIFQLLVLVLILNFVSRNCGNVSSVIRCKCQVSS